MNYIVGKMKVPNVHYNTEEKTYSLEIEDCPSDCQQQRICLRIRQTQQLIQDLVNKIGEKYPIFKNPTLIIVGSLKEGTKIGFVDELDMALLMNKKYEKDYFEFDEESICNKWSCNVPDKGPPQLRFGFFPNKGRGVEILKYQCLCQ